MKYKIVTLLSAVFLIFSIVVFAKPDFSVTTNTASGFSLFVPENAVQVADNIFSLGNSLDVDGRVVEGFMFIDDKKGNAKPETECGNGICEPGEKNKCDVDCGGGNGGGTGSSTCYSLISKGARWKETEPYLTDVDVDATLTETSLNTWDAEVSFNMFGTGSSGGVDGADDVSPDGKNEVMFDNLGATSTIAYTIVWGIFRGPPSGRELVEWDAVFNSAYPYGDADVSGSSVMDYQNIATHEFGHALGLDHPDDSCTEETMYRYADYGETKKRTLEAGDIAGVNELY